MRWETYDKVRLMVLEEQDQWEGMKDATHIRAEIEPYDIQKAQMLTEQGMFFADRTLFVTVNLAKVDPNLKRLARFAVEQRDLKEWKNEALDIASKAFTTDRRFHLSREYDPALAKRVIEGYLDAAIQQGGILSVVVHKEVPMGFTILLPCESDGYFIYLAAVLPEYQRTGAAVSLYYQACQLASEKGAKKLCGRISAANTPVMNLYAMLGGAFSQPKDVYLKEALSTNAIG